jgi:UPF0755 protein
VSADQKKKRGKKLGLKQVTGAVLNMVFRLSVSCIVIVLVYRLAMYSYHFGYMIFAEASVEPSPGRDITISVEMDDDAYDIGKTLEKRGLISDAKIFYAQSFLLEYRTKMLPGIYTLNTSMKAEEMMEIMSASDDSSEDSAEETTVESSEETLDGASEQSAEETLDGTSEQSAEETLDGASETVEEEQ